MTREEELLDLAPLTTMTKKEVIRLARDHDIPLPHPFNGTYFCLELFHELDIFGPQLIGFIGPGNWLYVNPPLLLEQHSLVLYQFLHVLTSNGVSWCLHFTCPNTNLEGYFVQEFNPFRIGENFITSYY
jgi:hypothetical protein